MSDIPEMRVCGTCFKMPTMHKSTSSMTNGWRIGCSNKKCRIRGGTPVGSDKAKLVKKWNSYYGLETPEVVIKRFLKFPTGKNQERMALVVGLNLNGDRVKEKELEQILISSNSIYKFTDDGFIDVPYMTKRGGTI